MLTISPSKRVQWCRDLRPGQGNLICTRRTLKERSMRYVPSKLASSKYLVPSAWKMHAQAQMLGLDSASAVP